MIRQFIYLLFILSMLYGCKKPEEVPGPVASSKNFQVLEAVSGKPVEGATVTFHKCDQRDFNGCYRRSPIISLITNKEGKVTCTTTLSIEDITIQHPSYWDGYAVWNSDNCSLLPVSTLKTRIKKVNSHGLTDELLVKIFFGDCYSFDCIRLINYTFGLPLDTTVYLKGFGYANNLVTWSINAGGTTQELPQFYINGFDTTSVLIEY